MYKSMNLNYQKSKKRLLNFRKVIIFALLTLFFCNISWGQNQRVTISGNNRTLLHIFEEIEKQTGLSIAYNQTKVDINRKVDQDFKDKTLSSVITKLLENSGFSYRMEGKHIIIIPAQPQQKKTTPNHPQRVVGAILDAANLPIIGANVVIKGTATGVISDLDGRFSLDAPTGSKLQISYIGYLSKEITVDNKANYTIQLIEDSQTLEEVVIVGYGTEKKVNVIGSIAQIGKEAIQNRSTPQLSNALTGQMSGVTIIQRSGRPGDSDGEIRVRGVGSFGATPTALVLIDGIPGSLKDVNTEDVESISVLKDASTAAIYGARGANGVILVTTKTGNEGKISVSYNGYVGINKPTELPQFVDTWQYATLYNEAAGRDVYTQDEIRKFKDGSDPDNYANARYLEEILSRNGLQTGHDLTVNGGNATNKYMLSFGYLSQDGLVEKNNFSRYNARINIINEIVPGLKLTTRLSGVHSLRKEPYTPGTNSGTDMLSIIGGGVRYPGIQPSVRSDGTFSPGVSLQGTPVAFVKSNSFLNNPYFNVNANIRLDYNPIKELQLSVIGAYDYKNTEEKIYRATLKLSNDLGVGSSSLSQEMKKTLYKTFQATADYSKIINRHSFGVLAGYAWEQEDQTTLKGSRDKFPGNDLPFLNAGSPDNQQASGGAYGWAIQSYFGRLRYNFAERYLFESTFRYDGSSRFPKTEKFGLFPSVALGWRLSEENFMKENDRLSWISSLKFKASWGRLGNQNISNYPYQNVYALGQNYPYGDNIGQGAAITTFKDPTIKWEETETIDGGIEAILWNGLLNANISYFYRNSYDILYKPAGSVSSILGQDLSVINTGKLQNVGWEFELGHRNKIGNVSYNINGNLSIINNKVLSLGVGNVDQLNGMVGNGTDLFIGHPMQIYYGYKSDGVFLNQEDIKGWHDQKKVTPNPQPGDIRYQDISGPDGVPDGVIDPNYDRVPLGSKIPRFTFGINLGVEYKGFDFSALIQGVAGVKGLLDNFAGFAFKGECGIQSWQAEGRFDPQNPTRYPAFPRLEVIASSSPNIITSDFWVLDASYIRLKNVQLGYTLPKKWLQDWKISNLRFYVQAENPLTWNKYREGWDPEINSDGSYYPILATYTFGVNFKF